MVTAGECEGGVVAEGGAGLVDAPPCGADQPGENQRLRLGAAFGKPLFDQQLVGAALRQCSCYARAGCSAVSRPRAASAVATMCLALSPATSYCAPWESCSMNTSGSTIGRIFRPWSSCPV